MKKILFLLLIAVIGIASCKKADMEVRVTNNFPAALFIKIGPTDYGEVASGETTDYKDVPDGSHQVTGTLAGGVPLLTGSITLDGKGKHKFTMSISQTGEVSLKED
jgi:hypothetical protein